MKLPDERPEIEYPCEWIYQVIGNDETALRGAVAGAVDGRAHHLELSNTSATGKYCSLRLEVRVEDERTRLAIFEALGAHADVRIVL